MTVQVKVDRFDHNFTWGYWIYEIRDEALYVFNLQTTSFELKAKAGELAENVAPTFALPMKVAPQFNKAIIDALTKQFGVSTEVEAGLKGELVATKGWLEDMRKLVFK